jgi:hypothetical protein
MNYGILFSTELQKVAIPVRGMVTAPLMGLGLAGPGIEYATMGMVKSPFQSVRNALSDSSVYDKSVVDSLTYRDGDYWSHSGTDVGAAPLMKHLEHNIPVPHMSDTRINQELDEMGILSKEMQAGNPVARLKKGWDDSAMMSRLTPQQQERVRKARHQKMLEMTNNTLTPHMIQGAQRRKAEMDALRNPVQ